MPKKNKKTRYCSQCWYKEKIIAKLEDQLATLQMKLNPNHE